MSQTPDSSYIRNQILKKYSLCVNCINRQINTDDKITISNNKKNCELCNNIYSNIDKLADIVISKLSEYQYSTFQIGVRGKLHWKVLHAVKLISIPSNSLNPANR